jgi:hypothetical protein
VYKKTVCPAGQTVLKVDRGAITTCADSQPSRLTTEVMFNNVRGKQFRNGIEPVGSLRRMGPQQPALTQSGLSNFVQESP